MIVLRRPLLTLASLLVLSLPAVSSAGAGDERVTANTGSKRIAYASREWLDLELNVNGVTVDRVKLHEAGRIKGLFTRHEEANRGTIVVTNRTGVKVNPAVAIAVMDAEGRLLAAANTGARTRSLDAGETAELDIHFGGVFRHIDTGSYLLASLEY